MSKLGIDIEISVACECGNCLDAKIEVWKGDYEIIVEPCEDCLAKKDDEINDITQEFEKMIDEHEETIEKMQDEIDALTIKKTFEKIQEHQKV